MTGPEIASKALHAIRVVADLAKPFVEEINPLAGALVAVADAAIDVADDAVQGKAAQAKLDALKAAYDRTMTLAAQILVEAPTAIAAMEAEVAAAGPKEEPAVAVPVESVIDVSPKE